MGDRVDDGGKEGCALFNRWAKWCTESTFGRRALGTLGLRGGFADNDQDDGVQEQGQERDREKGARGAESLDDQSGGGNRNMWSGQFEASEEAGADGHIQPGENSMAQMLRRPPVLGGFTSHTPARAAGGGKHIHPASTVSAHTAIPRGDGHLHTHTTTIITAAPASSGATPHTVNETRGAARTHTRKTGGDLQPAKLSIAEEHARAEGRGSGRRRVGGHGLWQADQDATQPQQQQQDDGKDDDTYDAHAESIERDEAARPVKTPEKSSSSSASSSKRKRRGWLSWLLPEPEPPTPVDAKKLYKGATNRVPTLEEWLKQEAERLRREEARETGVHREQEKERRDGHKLKRVRRGIDGYGEGSVAERYGGVGDGRGGIRDEDETSCGCHAGVDVFDEPRTSLDRLYDSDPTQSIGRHTQSHNYRDTPNRSTHAYRHEGAASGSCSSDGHTSVLGGPRSGGGGDDGGGEDRPVGRTLAEERRSTTRTPSLSVDGGRTFPRRKPRFICKDNPDGGAMEPEQSIEPSTSQPPSDTDAEPLVPTKPQPDITTPEQAAVVMLEKKRKRPVDMQDETGGCASVKVQPRRCQCRDPLCPPHMFSEHHRRQCNRCRRTCAIRMKGQATRQLGNADPALMCSHPLLPTAVAQTVPVMFPMGAFGSFSQQALEPQSTPLAPDGVSGVASEQRKKVVMHAKEKKRKRPVDEKDDPEHGASVKVQPRPCEYLDPLCPLHMISEPHRRQCQRCRKSCAIRMKVCSHRAYHKYISRMPSHRSRGTSGPAHVSLYELLACQGQATNQLGKADPATVCARPLLPSPVAGIVPVMLPMRTFGTFPQMFTLQHGPAWSFRTGASVQTTTGDVVPLALGPQSTLPAAGGVSQVASERRKKGIVARQKRGAVRTSTNAFIAPSELSEASKE